MSRPTQRTELVGDEADLFLVPIRRQRARTALRSAGSLRLEDQPDDVEHEPHQQMITLPARRLSDGELRQ
jgi:hypothetical protein